MVIKTPAKVLFAAALIGGLYYGAKSMGWTGIHFGSSVVLEKGVVDLPTAPANAQTIGLTFSGEPSTSPTSKALKPIKLLIPAWNALAGLLYSNGGAITTEGSLMEKSGVKLTIERQDDDGVASTNVIKFAKEYHDNPSSAQPVIMADMADGMPALLSGINLELAKLDGGKCDYCLVIVGATGRSNGEDAFMGPASWKENPQNAIGGTVSMVARQGDFNTFYNWAKANGLPFNPDEKTYDPTAVNIINAADYVKAGTNYISNYSEEREVVQKGVDLHKKQIIHVDAVASWSPVDDQIATQKGGLVRIVSTKDYPTQMVCAIIVVKKWAEDNKSEVSDMLGAALKGGDEVKSFSQALAIAGKVSAEVYKEKDADYWIKLYKGFVEPDKTGTSFQVGGSAVFGLSDNLNYFGLAPGSTNLYSVVYKIYADADKLLYPTLFKTMVSADDVQYLDVLKELQTKTPANTLAVATTQTYSSGAGSQVVAAKNYAIQFATGSATLTPEGKATVDEIAHDLIVANALKASIDGYTDNQGSDNVNVPLSAARAAAVKGEIQSVSPANFPETRFTVAGHGSADPISDNTTSSGRAKNRRVKISETKD